MFQTISQSYICRCGQHCGQQSPFLGPAGHFLAQIAPTPLRGMHRALLAAYVAIVFRIAPRALRARPEVTP